MNSTSDIRTLSELEGVTVGIIFRHKACTAYAVRMELQNSPSSHWRGSSGSIYPLLKRLEKEGFIETIQDAPDGRGRKLLSLTLSGQAALKHWIVSLHGSNLVSEVFDPVRSRIFFLNVLPKDQQLEFARKILAELETYCETAESYLAERPASKDLVEHLGALGGYLNAQSRVALLKSVVDLLSG